MITFGTSGLHVTFLLVVAAALSARLTGRRQPGGTLQPCRKGRPVDGPAFCRLTFETGNIARPALFLHVSLGRPKGWARIEEWTRLRQGHIGALVIGAVFTATDALSTTGPVTSAALLVSGYYIAISTDAPAWWPDSPVRSPWVARVDLACLTSFAIALTWITVRTVAGW